MRYIKCPRCELNYIKDDEELCNICIKEVSGAVEKKYCYVCGRELLDDEEDSCSYCNGEYSSENI